MLIASCVLILLGALCLIGGKLWQFGLLKETDYKGKTIGSVADIVVGVPDKKGITEGIHDYYYPVVAFYAKGHLYKLQYHKGSNPSRFQLHERVDIRYCEQDPTKFEILTDHRMANLANTMYYLGFVFCCAGGIFFLLFATRY